MEVFTISCPACGKNNLAHTYQGQLLCKRCESDLTILVSIRYASARLRAEILTSLVDGDAQRADDALKQLSNLTPIASEDRLLSLITLLSATAAHTGSAHP